MASPSSEPPLEGSCSCGTVKFQVRAPFKTAGYCHCTRCQRRSGALWALNGFVDADGFAIVDGRQSLRTYQPSDGFPKSFCINCGGHLFAGNLDGGGIVAVRLGAVHGDPGIRPRWHQFVASAPEWEPLPDDGLPRYPGVRESD
jgi:hypothetical protein